MPVFAPVFCKGVGVERVIDGIAQGARFGVLASNLGLSAGQHLFACEADYSLATYLGKITAVDSYVHFQFAAPRAFSGGMVIVPDVSWQAGSVAASGGVDFSRESGIETLDTTGKELIHTKTKEAREFVELTITDVFASDWLGYKNFVESELAGGLGRFVAAYGDGDAGGVARCDTVKLRAPGAALSAKRSVRVLRSWAVELQVVQAGVYGA